MEEIRRGKALMIFSRCEPYKLQLTHIDTNKRPEAEGVSQPVKCLPQMHEPEFNAQHP